jgi:signal transduction histidine kinase
MKHQRKLPVLWEGRAANRRGHRSRHGRRALDVAYQDRLRALASQAAERERGRIARGLHDQLGPLLALAKMKIGAMKAATDREEKETHLEDLRTVLEEAIRATRSLTFELGSPGIEHLGLEAALQSLGEEVGTKCGIRVRFESDGGPISLPDETSLVLYQAVRELLFNVVKHAGTRSASVATARRGECVRITVRDGGVGFCPEELRQCFTPSGGFGLLSLRERLEYLGGRMELESSPGRGTQVVLEVPLRGARSSHERSGV